MRKSLFFISAASFSLVFLLNGCGTLTSPIKEKQSANVGNQVTQQVVAAPVYKRGEIISSPEAAQQLLIEGNRRFTSGNTLSKDLSLTRRSDLMKNGQHPFAVILSCSDSRVPPELLLDQALGDLFVVRVAGNVVSPVEVGSIEYAVEHLNVPLVVVLGHEECGAVTAAVQGGENHGSIEDILDKIKPSVSKARKSGAIGKDLIEKSSDLNIQNALCEISKSPIIQEGVKAKQIRIIGAKYDLDEGVLKFMNDYSI
ncbi:MAG: carbonic anhydrase [Bacillota bacterium]|nr:carbonic anhydrase [Bacillota bacterium]